MQKRYWTLIARQGVTEVDNGYTFENVDFNEKQAIWSRFKA